MTVPGMTREHIQPWVDDPIGVALNINNRLERFELPDSDGR